MLVASAVIYLAANLIHLVRAKVVTGPLYAYPKITVCVPARNEARDIEACLRSLLAQEYPDFEVIAVDDSSTDDTLAIMQTVAHEDPRLTVVRGLVLAEGWLGKPFALHQAVQRAGGEFLLFTDADPVFHPRALVSAVYLMQLRNLDVLTLMPGAEFLTFWERAVQPVFFGFIAALSRFKKINSPAHSEGMGVGAFLMFRRSAYERTGGHEAVRQDIVEDIALAKCAKAQGCSLLLADGKNLLTIRMYHSLEEIRRGWKKNVFIAMKRSILRTVYYMVLIPAFVLGPYLVAVAALLSGGGWFVLAPALAALALSVGAAFALCDELRLPRFNAVFFPLGAVVLSNVLFDSMKGVLVSGTTEWRGRTFATPEKRNRA